MQLLKDDVQDNSNHIRRGRSPVNRNVISIPVNFSVYNEKFSGYRSVACDYFLFR